MKTTLSAARSFESSDISLCLFLSVKKACLQIEQSSKALATERQMSIATGLAEPHGEAVQILYGLKKRFKHVHSCVARRKKAALKLGLSN
jgi:hypothetical protein